MSEQLVKYETEQGEVQLSPQTIKNYLVSGDASKVTDQEVMMFLQLCKYQRLNPFLREAYLIKFGNEPATIVTGKETFTKRASGNELCAGWEAGVVVQADDTIKKREGTLVLENEMLVGGWARVHRKDWKVPLENTVSLSEYQRRKKDGSIMSNWKNMPATMVRKVALVQALREAMPQDFQGLYSPEEMPVEDSNLQQNAVEPPKEEGRQLTKEQGKRITELYNELGLERDGMVRIMSKVCGRDVQSAKELTEDEADSVIDALSDIANTAPEEEATDEDDEELE